MKKIFLTSVCCFAAFFLFAQSASDTIEIKKSFWGTTFTKSGETLKMKNLLDLTKSNSVAYGQIKKARNKNVVGSIFGGVGGFLVGYTVGTAIAGKDPNWAVAGAGAGLIGAGLIFSASAGKYAKKGVQTYNQGLRTTGASKVTLQGVVAANKVGVRLSF